ncbi:hypothetical protein C1Y40_02333 [Mycobacterium talmoniae]|uniref:Uncharacterized protein n=1 Tax=Mycobacterium talmoniae TaxID=1858794 RepID=A0A2S8BLC7_9MYCO|nr:hypothetical protein C1Y40_02333 [Mycobacterium talmoniae]
MGELQPRDPGHRPVAARADPRILRLRGRRIPEHRGQRGEIEQLAVRQRVQLVEGGGHLSLGQRRRVGVVVPHDQLPVGVVAAQQLIELQPQLPAVGAQRGRDLVADQLPHAQPGDGARQPRQQPPEGQRVIGGFAQQPPGWGRREPLLHRHVVQQVRLADAVQFGQPGPMPQHLAHGEGVFAVDTELGPVVRDRRVVVDQPPVDQSVDDRGGHALGRREDHGAGVGRPWDLAAAVRPARPHIDDGLTVQIYGQCPTAEAAPGEQGGEAAHRAGEVGIRRTAYAAGQVQVALCKASLPHDFESTCRVRKQN